MCNKGGQTLIACPVCGELGCGFCDDGYFEIVGCPKEYLGGDFIEAVNLATMSSVALPVAGGLMDQTPWFLQLVRTIDSECSRIEHEQINNG